MKYHRSTSLGRVIDSSREFLKVSTKRSTMDVTRNGSMSVRFVVVVGGGRCLNLGRR